MNYTNAKKTIATFLILYAFVGFGAHATSVSTEDAYPFFSWFLFVTVPPRIQSGFDIMLVSVDGERLETPVHLLDRPDVFSSEGVTERELSEITQRFAHSIRGKRHEQISELRRMLEVHFSTHASYAVREYSYDPLEYFKNKKVSSSIILAEFLVGK